MMIPRTAECVTPYHPDKLCDRISDAILDACLEQDPMSRVAIEVMGGHGCIDITGELTTKAYVDMGKIAKGLAGKNYGVKVNVVQQSPNIAGGVDTGGAGDQGIMRGYACDENELMMPQEYYLARSLAQFLFEKYPYDGKTQITLGEYGEITEIVSSFQNVEKSMLEKSAKEWIKVMDLKIIMGRGARILCNPAGDWELGSFDADTGVTGRKLIVDNYGPQVAIGGGAFSGKDATKVDRSAAYMARKIATDYLRTAKEGGEKNIKVWVTIAYAIGVAEPVMATAEVEYDHAQGRFKEQHNLLEKKEYDLTPKGIIELLDLRKPQFENTARWGHFGNGFKWEIK